ncbi:MAG TPA: ester cyclase [Candidatus Limnocylindrales bacterium]|jgi:predicted ester cyclase|nr:ester cyclase [Candidatus Limnocylindrales bacterium]
MTVETTMTETNEQICRTIIERGFNDGDLDGLDAFVAADIIEHQDGAASGIDGLRALIGELRSQFSDLHLEIQDAATSGDTVWFRIRATGTNDGLLWGRPATGRPIDITVMDVMRVADGRMVEHWGVADRLAVLKQVGAMGGAR